jgi:hypothetical protein
MRKWVVMSLIGALALVPAAAFADVDIDVDIEKDKRKIVFEKVVKFKAALILALVVKITDKAAESETLVNQTNTGNFEFDFFAFSESLGFVSDNSGITGVNLSSGNMNNQANAVSVAVAGLSGPATINSVNNDSRLFFGGSFAESQAAADQKNERNDVISKFSVSLSGLGVSDNSGITGVNQASGHMNNQANAVSVAIGVGPAISLSEADLGQVNAWNTAINIASVSLAIAEVSGNTGITGVNQSSGHMNNQANVVSVAATR